MVRRPLRPKMETICTTRLAEPLSPCPHSKWPFIIYRAITVTEFKHRCLEIIRAVEKTGRSVSITRRGKVVARLEPSTNDKATESVRPWQRLRGRATCLFEPGESVLKDEDFEALR